LRTTTLKKADDAPSTPDISDTEAADRVLELVMESLDDSKAEDIVSIDIQGKSAMADYMVIASGRSHRHVARSRIICCGH
jgi:ribosome-associated protein